MFIKRAIKYWVVISLSAAVAVLTDASPSVSAEASADQGDKLEEIIVTAQKRAENLQTVPISAQVVSGQFLSEQNRNTLEDLTETVPGVHVGGGGQELFIRGIGSGNNPSFDQSVSMFTDDIYHGRSRLSLGTFLDLDRIEVLKGPQTTFFGNNAIAGALNIVTMKPGDSFDAWGRLLYGQFGQYAAEGAIGGPITDTLGVRLAVTRNGESGWIENVNTGRDAPDQNNEAARVTLVYKPTADLDATFKIEGSEQRTSGTAGSQPYQWSNCPPPAPLPPSSGGAYGSCAQALALGNAIPMGLNNNINTGLPGQGSQLSTFEDVLTVNYRQWGQTFTSVTGFNNYHANSQDDAASLPVPFLTIEQPEKYHQFSQEFRVASPTDQPIEYLAGAYVQIDQLDYSGQFNIGFLTPAIENVQAFAPLKPYLPFAQRVSSSEDDHVYSVFGSLSWNATDRLKASASLRASTVTKDIVGDAHYGVNTGPYTGFVQDPPVPEQLAGAILQRPPGESQNLSQTERALMPSARIQYQISPGAMGYFSYSRGFKAGGFDGQSLTLTNFEYGPEHVNAYELGLKSTWFDDTVLLNVDVFRSDYTGLQVESAVYQPQLNGYVVYVANAAISRSQGLEFEGQWAVSKNFRLSANVTYLESYYVNYPGAAAPDLQSYCGTLTQPALSATPQCAAFSFPVPTYTNLAGQPTLYSPKWSASAAARYIVPLPGDFKFSSQLSPYYTSSYNPDAGGLYRPLGNYVRLDGRLTLETPDGRWALDVIGKNLTDRVILTTLNTKEEPRNVAVQVRFHW